MVDPNHNPILGFTLLDKNHTVIYLDRKWIDPVFHSEARALEAAAEYGRQAEVHKVGPLWLEGTFNVVLYDEGDLKFDGPTAKRFVEALKIRGMVPNKKAARHIDPTVLENKYSCRELFGDIDYNRNVALEQ